MDKAVFKQALEITDRMADLWPDELSELAAWLRNIKHEPDKMRDLFVRAIIDNYERGAQEPFLTYADYEAIFGNDVFYVEEFRKMLLVCLYGRLHDVKALARTLSESV